MRVDSYFSHKGLQMNSLRKSNPGRTGEVLVQNMCCAASLESNTRAQLVFSPRGKGHLLATHHCFVCFGFRFLFICFWDVLIWKAVTERDGGWIFHSSNGWFTPSRGHHGQGWTRSKPRAWNSFLISNMVESVQTLGPLFVAFQSTWEWDWVKSGTPRIYPVALLGCQHHRQKLILLLHKWSRHLTILFFVVLAKANTYPLIRSWFPVLF